MKTSTQIKKSFAIIFYALVFSVTKGQVCSITITVDGANNNMICAGRSVTLTTNATSGYSWSTGASTSSVVVTPTAATVYSLSAVVNGTCTAATSVTISVFQPDFYVTNDTGVCRNVSVNLVASGASQYTWQPGNATAVPFISVSPSINTIYTVSAMSQTVNGLTCLSHKTILVSIYMNPTITATAEKTLVCKNEQITLSASGAITYTWSNANNAQGSTITVSPTAETTYWVVGTDANGCRDTTNILVKFSICAVSKEQNDERLIIFPNPGNGSFSIRAVSDMRLELVNELGQVVRIINLNKANSYTVQLDGLAAGVYFLNGRQNEVVLSEKIVIQR